MPREVDVDGRRRQVQDAVVAVAAKDGFGAVTLRRVAAETGASTSVVTHYIPTREQLVRGTIEREAATRRQLLLSATEDKAPSAALRALVESAVLGTDEQSHRFWLAIVLGAHSDPVLCEELDRFNDWWDRQVRRLVVAVEPSLQDRAAVLDAVAVLTDGMIVARFEQDRPWSARRCRRALDLLLDPLIS